MSTLFRESQYNVWVEHQGSFYVYNGIGGGLLRLPAVDYWALQRCLAGENDSGCSRKVLYDMMLGRMLVPVDFDEVEMLASRYRATQADLSRLALTLVTSLGCNFNCPYCFEAKEPSVMSAEVQTAVLALVDEQLPTLKTLAVTWYGGEPLIGRRPLYALSDAFIARCDRAGITYEASIITNGFLLDVPTCRALKARRIGHAQITLDGPPEVHDARRPQRSGLGSFHRIVANLHCAIEYLNISIRVNIDAGNLHRTEELLQILAAEGLAGRLTVYPGQVVGIDDGGSAPSATYRGCCLSNAEFARAEQQFLALCRRYGFAAPVSLPRPSGAPCTAVRRNELIVGSRGELYKCFDSVGNPNEVVGDIRDYHHPNGRLARWLKYDPFADPECRACPALPVCMGGCAHHAMNPKLYDNRCGTFRHTWREQILSFIEAAERGEIRAPATGHSLNRPIETR